MKKEIPCVIKDYWPVDGHDSEDVIRQSILDNIKDITEKAAFRESTFTPIASERAKNHGCDEHTRKTILRGKAILKMRKLELLKEEFGSKENSRAISYKLASDISRDGAATMESNRLDIYPDRWHHRIVYNEYATPFYKLKSIKDMILVLEHSVEGTSVNLPTYQSGAV